jgi:hypothetical protein
MLIDKFSVKYCDHGSVSHIGFKHLSPTKPPISTLYETSSASQVFLKGMVVRVLLVHC